MLHSLNMYLYYWKPVFSQKKVTKTSEILDKLKQDT